MTNDQIDMKILTVIRCNVSTAGAVQRALFPNPPRDSAEDYTNMRIVDKSLQRLRRAGKIVFAKRAWTIAV
jgi:hypothetical protein